MEHTRYATKLRSLADALVNGTTKATQYPVKAKHVHRHITNTINQTKRYIIRHFKQWWGVSHIPSDRYINQIDTTTTLGTQHLNATGALLSILKEGQATYKTHAKDTKVRQLSPIKFNYKFRQAFATFAHQYKLQF